MRLAARVDQNHAEIAEAVRFTGSANPNYRGVMHMTKRCPTCGSDFLPGYAHKTRVYCSHGCYTKDPAKADERRSRSVLSAKKASLYRISHQRPERTKKPPKEKVCVICGAKHVRRQAECCSKPCSSVLMSRNGRKPGGGLVGGVCAECGSPYTQYRSAQKRGRKFCSYECFINSGGAIRAGLAARSMRAIYGAKKDANHKEIAATLEALGCSIIDLSTMGHGLPDMLVFHEKAGTHLVEVKNTKTSYGRKGANKNQRAWAANWANPIYIIKSVDEAIKFTRGELHSLSKYGGWKAQP